jgi:hypothetical protein
MNTPKYIIVHCSDTSYAISKSQFNQINNYHRDERGFPRSSLGFYVGYHKLITGGKVYQARLDSDEGAHCNQVRNGMSMNFQSLGICIGFDGDIEMPTLADAIMMRDEVWAWQDKYNIPTTNILFHRDFAKDKTCPGSLITREWLENLLRRTKVAIPTPPPAPVIPAPPATFTIDIPMLKWLITFLRERGIIIGSINTNQMDTSSLWLLRLKSFGISFGGMIGTAILGVIFSDQFAALVQEYTGTAFFGTIITLVLAELGKHFRNKIVIGRAQRRFGSVSRGDVQLL